MSDDESEKSEWTRVEWREFTNYIIEFSLRAKSLLCEKRDSRMLAPSFRIFDYFFFLFSKKKNHPRTKISISIVCINKSLKILTQREFIILSPFYLESRRLIKPEFIPFESFTRQKSFSIVKIANEWKNRMSYSPRILLSGFSLERKKALKRIYTVLSFYLFRKRMRAYYI